MRLLRARSDRLLFRGCAVAFFAILLGCSPRTGVHIEQGYIREPPAGAATTAAYATLTNFDDAVQTVVAIDTPLAGRTEIHETRLEDGMMRMRMLEQLQIPPGQTIRLEPGAVHLMLLGVGTVDAATYPVTFHFDDGRNLTLPFHVNRLGKDDP